MPFFMQGHFGPAVPQGPCIINSETSAYPSGSPAGSGISAETEESIRDGVTTRVSSLSCQTRICACGSPLFWNSTVCRTEEAVKNKEDENVSEISKERKGSGDCR